MPIFCDQSELMGEMASRIKPLGSFAEWIALCSLLSDISVMEWVKEWKLSKSIKQDAQSLVQMSHCDIDAWSVYQLPVHLDQGYCRLMEICKERDVQDELISIRRKLPISNGSELAISGGDLINLFPDRKKGSWIRDLLLASEKAVVENRIENEKNKLKEWIIHGHDA